MFRGASVRSTWIWMVWARTTPCSKETARRQASDGRPKPTRAQPIRRRKSTFPPANSRPNLNRKAIGNDGATAREKEGQGARGQDSGFQGTPSLDSQP